MLTIDLTGRRALVTGGARGIGAAIVRVLAQCIRNMRRFADLASRLAASPIEQMQEAGDPIALSELLWQQTIQI